MRNAFLRHGLAAGMLVVGLGAAQAAPFPVGPRALGLDTAATPVAMCGVRCRSGGRYIPGPPSVCAMHGLNYCGSSRAPAVVVPPRVFVDPMPRPRPRPRHCFVDRFGRTICR